MIAFGVGRTALRAGSSAAKRWPLLRSGKNSRVAQRNFCEAKEAKPNNASVPPPPPPESSGGSSAWILILAALGGGGYYFQDDIKKALGMDESKSPAPVAAVEKKAAPTPVQAQPVSSPAKETIPEAPKAKPAAPVQAASGDVDYKAVREAIADILDDESYDDGSYGPVFVRLAWHSAGTYDKKTKKGGSEGAGMRFPEEGGWGANAGLDVARAKLEPIKAKFPGITYADLWSLAGTTAIEEMGGPDMKWRPGRKDHDASYEKLPDGLLPDADGRDKLDRPSDHLRDIFYRMGFNDKEIVCLSGAHALGRCHEDRSGYWGPWTYAPTTFSNEYFRLLLEERWSKKKTHKGREWTGPEQYETENGELMMLPTDLSLVWDDKLRPHVEAYAKDEELFMKDFKKAWMKLQELGVKKFHGWRRYIVFGPRE